MKRGLIALFMLAICAIACVAYGAEEDVKAIPSCEVCGMNRDSFGSSRMLIEYADGTKVGTCSIRCAMETLCNVKDKDKKVASVKVADYNTRVLLDADKAFWTIGGDKSGVMTRTAKWAFATEAAAQAFIKEHGGQLATYAEAKKAAEDELTDMGKGMKKGAKKRVKCNCCDM
jgi:nitrous oxide reductase accessory protein NosL